MLGNAGNSSGLTWTWSLWAGRRDGNHMWIWDLIGKTWTFLNSTWKRNMNWRCENGCKDDKKLRWNTRSTCPRTCAWRNPWPPWDQVEQTRQTFISSNSPTKRHLGFIWGLCQCFQRRAQTHGLGTRGLFCSKAKLLSYKASHWNDLKGKEKDEERNLWQNLRFFFPNSNSPPLTFQQTLGTVVPSWPWKVWAKGWDKAWNAAFSTVWIHLKHLEAVIWINFCELCINLLLFPWKVFCSL